MHPLSLCVYLTTNTVMTMQDPLGLSANGVNPDYATAEIKHCRLAMIGTLGMLLGQFYEPSKGVLQQTIDWAQAQA